MRNKNKLLIALLILLVAALAIGGTIAWFSDSDKKTNVATLGDVEVELTENVENPDEVEGVTENPDGTPDDPTNPKYTVPDPENPDSETPLIPGEPTDDGAEYPSSQPGTSYVKAPVLENKEEDVFVRFLVTRQWDFAEGDIDKIILHTINDTEWAYEFDATTKTDIFTLKAVLGKGETTKAPFDYFTISSTVDNSYAGKTATIEVLAQAIQAAGLSVNYAEGTDIPDNIWASVSASDPIVTPAP